MTLYIIAQVFTYENSYDLDCGGRRGSEAVTYLRTITDIFQLNLSYAEGQSC
jgi:hypothetical protein